MSESIREYYSWKTFYQHRHFRSRKKNKRKQYKHFTIKIRKMICIFSSCNKYSLLHGIFHIIPFISPRSCYQPESR